MRRFICSTKKIHTKFKTTINSLAFASQNCYQKNSTHTHTILLSSIPISRCQFAAGQCTFVVGVCKYSHMQTHGESFSTYQSYCCVCASLLIFLEIHLPSRNSPQFHSVFPNSLMWCKLTHSFGGKFFFQFFSFSLLEY